MSVPAPNEVLDMLFDLLRETIRLQMGDGSPEAIRRITTSLSGTHWFHNYRSYEPARVQVLWGPATSTASVRDGRVVFGAIR